MLANRIILLRKSHGMSQLQLAQALHISASAEGMYEQGRRTPSLESLVAMSRLFDVSLDHLITGSEYNPDAHHRDPAETIICPCCVYCCKTAHRK